MNCLIFLLFFTVHANVYEANFENLYPKNRLMSLKDKYFAKNEKAEPKSNGKFKKKVSKFIGKWGCVGNSCDSVEVGAIISQRIVAIGDIHGDYKKTVTLLIKSQLINQKHEWIGGNTILIQLVLFLFNGLG